MRLLDFHPVVEDHFEGPMDLLWQLVQRNEIDIYAISLHQMTEQYTKRMEQLAACDLDQGAEFIALSAAFLWLKSKTLLPKHEQLNLVSTEEHDPYFDVIHHLIDYSRFRQAAKDLSEREQKQSALHARGTEERGAAHSLGINHLSLDDLAVLFRHALSKAEVQKGMIHEEEWRVSDKIAWIRGALSQQGTIPFESVFSAGKTKEELIVLFLALLELMKMGEVQVTKEAAAETVFISAKLNDGEQSGKRN